MWDHFKSQSVNGQTWSILAEFSKWALSLVRRKVNCVTSVHIYVYLGSYTFRNRGFRKSRFNTCNQIFGYHLKTWSRMNYRIKTSELRPRYFYSKTAGRIMVIWSRSLRWRKIEYNFHPTEFFNVTTLHGIKPNPYANTFFWRKQWNIPGNWSERGDRKPFQYWF